MDTTRTYEEITGTGYDINHILYTIKRGDTLTSIAREFNVTIESIAKLNDIKDINLIYAGDRLRIEG
ncbi:MAG: LysM peptidoglycan-binding domain-containing protein [Clostridia bacterium]|nr:LysM peptidoglycan-binding domain-containing protein [Clostridia bacterium]